MLLLQLYFLKKSFLPSPLIITFSSAYKDFFAEFEKINNL